MRSTSGDHILQERNPADSLIPPLNGTLDLSQNQIKFLLHAIRDVNPNVPDSGAEIRQRIIEIQSRAYETYPYPCIRGFLYVSLFMSKNDAFLHILGSGQCAENANAPLLLDIGCCMGTDLRHLVHSGYPSTSVIGCDIRSDFIDLGHALYADRETCQIPFFVADVFEITLRPFPQTADKAGPSLKDVQRLNELCGRVKYIYAGSFFHLFDEGTQEAIARRLATLLDVTDKGGPAVIFGRHFAKVQEGVIDDALGRTRYAHSPASWGRMWERVLGEKIPVRVDAELHLDYRKTNRSKGAWWNPGLDTEMMFWSVWVG